MPKALLIAYHFPPAQAVGGFRTLRFAKFLPDFGWQPLVLTVSPDAIRGDVDPALLALCPETVSVERTNAFHPVKFLQKLKN